MRESHRHRSTRRHANNASEKRSVRSSRFDHEGRTEPRPKTVRRQSGHKRTPLLVTGWFRNGEKRHPTAVPPPVNKECQGRVPREIRQRSAGRARNRWATQSTADDGTQRIRPSGWLRAAKKSKRDKL